MKSSDASAATLYGMGTTAESPFDGDLISKLREWGYNDNTPAMQKLHDLECNMNSASGHMLSKVFLDLGLDTKSKNNGGPNQCFQIEHFDGPTVIKDPDGSVPPKSSQYYEVCKVQYRVTGAEHTIGVNAAGGAVFAISLSNAAKSARRLWRVAPQTEKLPHIRSVSDISWAFWHRAVAETEGADLKNIRYFFVNMVINTETSRHIKRALKSLTPPHEDPVDWPGHEFSMETDAGNALLGSPVGRWAGYFLMQHKRQLGGNKFISKVRVFKSEKEGSLPYLLFYVDGPIVTLKSSFSIS
ncbi:Mitochondrial import inner membrane translocase subunit tim8 [Neodidymelliopsis sp. IMI 364377]|nr:Mitochondrial import inner membrane translocase subunit tim8 [Neodidymelliopsis sp. IMI 364377]